MNEYWGPRLWILMHFISFRYPKRPSRKDIKHFAFFFSAIVPMILPCTECVKHYQELLLKTVPIGPFLRGRYYLINWVIEIHNQVNKRLGKPTLHPKKVIKWYQGKTFQTTIQQLLSYIEQEAQGGRLSAGSYHQLHSWLKKTD